MSMHAGLSMALRDEPWSNMPPPDMNEMRAIDALLWDDFYKSELLSNYRLTLTSTPWSGEIEHQERGLAERLFKEGC